MKSKIIESKEKKILAELAVKELQEYTTDEFIIRDDKMSINDCVGLFYTVIQLDGGFLVYNTAAGTIFFNVFTKAEMINAKKFNSSESLKLSYLFPFETESESSNFIYGNRYKSSIEKELSRWDYLSHTLEFNIHDNKVTVVCDFSNEKLTHNYVWAINKFLNARSSEVKKRLS